MLGPLPSTVFDNSSTGVVAVRVPGGVTDHPLRGGFHVCMFKWDWSPIGRNWVAVRVRKWFVMDCDAKAVGRLLCRIGLLLTSPPKPIQWRPR